MTVMNCILVLDYSFKMLLIDHLCGYVLVIANVSAYICMHQLTNINETCECAGMYVSVYIAHIAVIINSPMLILIIIIHNNIDNAFHMNVQPCNPCKVIKCQCTECLYKNIYMENNM